MVVVKANSRGSKLFQRENIRWLGGDCTASDRSIAGSGNLTIEFLVQAVVHGACYTTDDDIPRSQVQRPFNGSNYGRDWNKEVQKNSKLPFPKVRDWIPHFVLGARARCNQRELPSLFS